MRQFFEAHGEGRFTHWGRAKRDDDHAPKTLHRAGFRKAIMADVHTSEDELQSEVIGWEFYTFQEVFRSEMCEGFDYKAVLRVLREREHLVPDKGRPFDCKPRLPGLGPTTCYRIKSSIFEGDASA